MFLRKQTAYNQTFEAALDFQPSRLVLEESLFGTVSIHMLALDHPTSERRRHGSDYPNTEV
jgi:hypothetical protein